MPFLTYQCGEDKAVEFAGKIIQNTYAKAVKVEGAEPEIQKVISRLIRMGIPVMGHLGLTPQSYLNLGLKKQGKSLESQGKIRREASILEKLGCFSIVLEHIPEQLAKELQSSLTIPTIGIGAGNYCDGQVRVTADLLGLNDDQPPFCQPIIQGKKLLKDKLKEWVTSQRLN
jgi:3-methyl-2-oxobutanoate hydroxymethyltransferase